MKKRITILILLLVFFSLPQIAFAQKSNGISGKITDEINKPLENQVVGIKKLDGNKFVEINQTITNENGEFSFGDLTKNKTYLIEFNYLGLHYSEIVNYPDETEVDFEVKELNENGVIKGRILGAKKVANVTILKDNDKIRSIKPDEKYYKFEGLEKNQEYTIKLVSDNTSYEKTVRTDDVPTTSQILNFNFSTNLSVTLSELGAVEENEYEIKLFHQDQLIEEIQTREKKTTFNNLLRNTTYQVVVVAQESTYTSDVSTDSGKVETEIPIYYDGKLCFKTIKSKIRIDNTTKPKIKLHEKVLVNKTSFLLNNTIDRSYDGYFIINGELDYPLPKNHDIKNISLTSNSIESFNYGLINESLLKISFNNSKLLNKDELTFDLSYKITKNYDGLISEKIQISKVYKTKTNKIDIDLVISKGDKHDITKSIKTDYNVSKTQDGYTLLNQNSSHYTISINWNTISNIQLLVYAGAILALALAIIYSVFISLIGKKGTKKDINKKEKDSDEKLMSRAAQSAIKKLEERYKNDEISKEEFENKKEFYKKMKEDKNGEE